MAVPYNLYVEQGADFYHELFLHDDSGNRLDLTNYTARSQFRRSYRSSTYTNFVLEIGNQALDVERGRIIFRLADTATIDLRPGRYVFDLEIESDDGNVIRVVEGIVTISPNVTRAP